METVKRLKRLSRRLLRLIAGRPKRVTWRDGDPDCGVISLAGESYRTITHDRLWIAVRFIDAGDLFVAALMALNGSDRSVRVNPRLSSLQTWRDAAQGPAEKLGPTRFRPSDLLESKSLAPKESVAVEIYFAGREFEAACFAILINGAFYQFAISPAQSSGSIGRRTSCSA
jgi:hypothetical protein